MLDWRKIVWGLGIVNGIAQRHNLKRVEGWKFVEEEMVEKDCGGYIRFGERVVHLSPGCEARTTLHELTHALQNENSVEAVAAACLNEIHEYEELMNSCSQGAYFLDYVKSARYSGYNSKVAAEIATIDYSILNIASVVAKTEKAGVTFGLASAKSLIAKRTSEVLSKRKDLEFVELTAFAVANFYKYKEC